MDASFDAIDVPQFSARSILEDRTTAFVRQNASFLSLDFAILGRIDIATEIQALLHNRNYIPEGMYDGARNYWPLLNFAWEAANIAGPGMDDNAQLEARQKKEIEWVEQQCLEGWANWNHLEDMRRQEDIQNRLKCIFDKGVSNVPAEEVLSVLDELTRASGVGTVAGMAASTRAMDLLMENDKLEKAKDILIPLIEYVRKNWEHRFFQNFPKTRYAWKLLATGIVSQKLGLDEKRIEEKGRDAVQAIEKRLRDGPDRRPLQNKSIAELVDMIEQNLGHDRLDALSKERVPEQPRRSGRQPQVAIIGLRRAPASDEEISNVEEQLQVELPEDFKAFLRVSNGFNGDSLPWQIDGINGTSELERQPPLIEGFKLELFPWPESWVNPSIEGVPYETMIRLSIGTNDRDELYLIEPKYMDEARARLWTYYETEAEDWMKTILDMSVNTHFGGKEELAQVGWGIMRYQPGGIMPEFTPGFRVYLEDMATESLQFKEKYNKV